MAQNFVITRIPRLLLLFLFLATATIFSSSKQFLMMINPAGDARNPGRRLARSYERGISMQFAEKLQQGLRKRYGMRVELTRRPGEVVPELQNASFANRAQVNFFLSLHFYHEESPKPNVSLYHLVYNPLVDLAPRSIDPFSFMPVECAHWANAQVSRSIAQNMKEKLTNLENPRLLDCSGPVGLPFKPLRGITAPAVAIEIGLCEENAWESLIEPIIESLACLMAV